MKYLTHKNLQYEISHTQKLTILNISHTKPYNMKYLTHKNLQYEISHTQKLTI